MLQQIQALVFLLVYLFSSSPPVPADFLFTDRKLTQYKIQIKEHILPRVCSTYGIAHDQLPVKLKDPLDPSKRSK